MSDRGFIDQLVELCIAIAEDMISNAVEANLNFSGVCKRQLLKLSRKVRGSLLHFNSQIVKKILLYTVYLSQDSGGLTSFLDATLKEEN